MIVPILPGVGGENGEDREDEMESQWDAGGAVFADFSDEAVILRVGGNH